MTNTSTIRIYMACLASYNNGILHGRWIDATQGVKHLQTELNNMLKDSPMPDAEEWALHDYEGFEGISLSEWESLERVAELAAFIEDHGELGGAMYQHYGALEDSERALTECYIGAYDSVEDYAREITEQTVTIPQALAYYIDYEAMGRDMAINDLVVIEDSSAGVHLFYHH